MWEVGTHSEASRSISSHGPTPATVQCCSFLHENSDDTSTTERFGVDLTLDFKGVKGEKDDLSDTSQTVQQSGFGTSTQEGTEPSSGSLHHHLALPLSEGV